MKVRVRFAPSPTGFLHLGNVRTALFNFLFARKEKGTFILRIEDTDPERSREEYVEQILKDLSWLGIEWDEGPGKGGSFGPYRQSERLSLYRRYAEQLIQRGHAYLCYCTEAELEEMKESFVAAGQPPRYDNRCRTISASDVQKKKARGVQPVVRLKVDSERHRFVTFNDLVRGEVSFDLSLFGDFVILRHDGIPTFHLAVCVDDGLMQVTHVIRGEDHISNTPRHILLFEALGFSSPQFAHLPLIFGKGDEPLSKRLGAMSIQEYRDLGYLPEALTNYLALLGWAPGDNRELMTREELIEAFDVKHIHKAHATFDADKFNWIAGEKVRALSREDYCKRVLEYSRGQIGARHAVPRPKYVWNKGGATGVGAIHELPLLAQAASLFQDNIRYFGELVERLEIFREDFTYENPEWLKTPESQEIFRTALSILPKLDKHQEPLYEAFVNELKSRVKAKGKNLFMPLRVALTGRDHGPELKLIFPVLGAEGVKRRLERALG